MKSLRPNKLQKNDNNCVKKGFILLCFLTFIHLLFVNNFRHHDTISMRQQL